MISNSQEFKKQREQEVACTSILLFAKAFRSPDTSIRECLFKNNPGPSQTAVAASTHDKPLVKPSQQSSIAPHVQAEKKRHALII
ncbi:hypothetical protein [Nonomuraea cavernae]|uniref:hypothetical protein n=1 Tax=Nonomuraea cavernae TaxID=2045107 RepID=UPI00166D4E27|nr:hypothetical protein [Nonomuraea cavernae]MCA2185688.1 hypothetical protein [Nonomuraea cavernae]